MDKPLSIETLVESSLSQYTEMKDVLTQIKSRIEEQSVENITDLLHRFTELGGRCKETDEDLVKNLRKNEVSENILERLELRKIIQAEIMMIIEQTVPKANNAKSYLFSEINSIKKGRNAMKGYQANLSHQGRIVNKSS